MSAAVMGLEQGWRQLEQGNTSSARRAAEHELRGDPENPEALVLLAACHRDEGELDDALRLLERAARSAPEWSEPEQFAAEILAHELEKPEDALAHARLALDRAEEEEEFLDAVVLKASLELQLGKRRAAQETLSELPPPNEVVLPPDLALDVAYLFLEAGATDEADRRFGMLGEQDPDNAEAWYGQGLCAEERDDEPAKRAAWLRTLELDDKAPLQTPHMSEADMAEVAEKALHELPASARKLIENVPILIVDLPARDEVEQGLDPRLLGLFAGSAYAEASSVGGVPQLTQILLFRKNLERMAIDPDDLREQIRITLLHETGHFFGMSEDDLAGVGLD